MQAKNPAWDIPVRYVKGVGPVKADLFKRLGIETVSDLFYYLPRRYEDRSDICPVADIKPGETRGVIGKVLKINVFTARTGTRILEVSVGDGKRRVSGVWYNQPFLKKLFALGQTVVLYGKCELTKQLQISHPAFEILEGEELKESLDVGRIIPIYSLTENLTQKYVRKVVHRAITAHAGDALDCLPTPVRARRKLVDTKFAVTNIHFPVSPENLERAYRRLVFEEFFTLQAVMAIRRRKARKKGVKHEVAEGLMEDFRRLFPFEFTDAQMRCIKDIEDDMTASKTMYRLLQGDVGSGKTVVAMYAMLLAAANGYQAAIMAPTEILARQHYVTISKALMPVGVNVRLLVNGIDAASRETIKRELLEGEADIIVGTHAIIQEGIEFSKLGLVVIDEQHKFGVDQRKALLSKGKTPDTLVMTATPIPRSLAMTVYGDMDISLLREKPAGRESVITYCVGEEKRDEIYAFVREEVAKGRQAFIVCPRVKQTGTSDLKSVEDTYESLSKGVFSDLKMAHIHGRMKMGEKKKIMEKFRDGGYDVLVATTVIEVGVDIPNVTVMVVEHAERYGLAQLHQLRGRIGRGKHASYCVLISEPGTEASEERLAVMAETDDGFRIAEKDMDIRGPGEFFGTRQSGLPEIRFGDIVKDFSIMEEAREDAFALVKEDPDLLDERHRPLAESIRERFRGKII